MDKKAASLVQMATRTNARILMNVVLVHMIVIQMHLAMIPLDYSNVLAILGTLVMEKPVTISTNVCLITVDVIVRLLAPIQKAHLTATVMMATLATELFVKISMIP